MIVRHSEGSRMQHPWGEGGGCVRYHLGSSCSPQCHEFAFNSPGLHQTICPHLIAHIGCMLTMPSDCAQHPCAIVDRLCVIRGMALGRWGGGVVRVHTMRTAAGSPCMVRGAGLIVKRPLRLPYRMSVR